MTKSQLVSPINIFQVFDLFNINFIEPFKISLAGFKFILNVIDYFS